MPSELTEYQRSCARCGTRFTEVFPDSSIGQSTSRYHKDIETCQRALLDANIARLLSAIAT